MAETELAEQLIENHIGLARHLAGRFGDRGETHDDLVQVAFLGLVKAAHRFDPDRGVQFSTFATATISGELKRHFRDHRWGLRVARPVQDRFLKVRAAVDTLTQQLGRSPSIAELAEAVHATSDDVIEALEAARSFRLVSVDGGGREDDASVADQLGTEEGGFATIEDREGVWSLVARLPARERELIKMRFEEELTQSQIAERIGVSQMQVSRILAKSLAKLRAWADEAEAGIVVEEPPGPPKPAAARPARPAPVRASRGA